MKALLVFGPGHGKDLSGVVGLDPPAQLALPRQVQTNFARQGPPEPGDLMIYVCRYTLLDVLSDDRTGEDCALYSHNPDCPCHEQKPPERNEAEQSFYDRYKAAQATAPDWMPGQPTAVWDAGEHGRTGFQVSGTMANPHYSVPAYSRADLMRDLGFHVVPDPNMPIGLRVIQDG